MLKEITSLQNPLVKHLVKLRQNHDYRTEHRQIIVEGLKIVKEVSLKHPLEILIVSRKELIPKEIGIQETQETQEIREIYLMSDEIIEKIGGVRSSEGILAVVKMPEFSSFEGLNRIIVLDGINDPGNMGTLLRTALALGWEGAFIVNESCDPYNEKAIRAARGATFHLPLQMGTWVELKEIVRKNNLTPVVADLDGDEIDVSLETNSILLVLANEARGPSKEALNLCKKISIPMSGEMESLNVAIAGGILMYALGPKLKKVGTC